MRFILRMIALITCAALLVTGCNGDKENNNETISPPHARCWKKAPTRFKTPVRSKWNWMSKVIRLNFRHYTWIRSRQMSR